MVILLIIGTAVAVILGSCFRVFVLVPVMLLATAVTIAIGTVSGHDSRVIALATLETLALLQVGYFVGCILRALLRVGITGWHRRQRSKAFDKKSHPTTS
jgi:hypothetical protein